MFAYKKHQSVYGGQKARKFADSGQADQKKRPPAGSIRADKEYGKQNAESHKIRRILYG